MLTIDIEVKGTIVVFSIQGEISPANSREFSSAFEKYLGTDCSVMAIDLKKVRYIDSFGISKLVKLSRAFAETGGEFLIVNMNDNIRQIFRMATFDKMFKILTDEQFAGTYLAPGRNPAPVSVNSGSRVKTDAIPGDVNSAGYRHDDITGTTLLFEDEDSKTSDA